MIEVCSDHSSLLRAIATNLKDEISIGVYADWLQDRGCEGWLVVRYYPVQQWAVWTNPEKESSRRSKCSTNGWYNRPKPDYTNIWTLPWISGSVTFNKWVEQPVSRMKRLLLAFANGEAR